MTKYLIFSDIDNTLVQSYVRNNGEMIHSDGYGDIKKFIMMLKKNQIPLILCSTKTRIEQEKIRKDLEIDDPYIVENGGAIIFSKSYFDLDFENLGLDTKEMNGNLGIVLGKSYEKIVEILNDIRNNFQIRFKTVSDFSIEELADKVGISIEDAKLMASREYSETIIEIHEDNRIELERKLKDKNLMMVQGTRYFTVSAFHNKGSAVSILKNLFYKKCENEKVEVIAIGDALNDVSMFENVDQAFLVRNIFKGYARMDISNLKRVKGIAQEGWKEVILNYVLERN
ncbi:MAG: HAD-IIB family hydrolase [Nitrososphaeraceae archaeon]